MFLGLDQIAWTAIASLGSILVVIVALIPILLDKANIKVTIKALDEIGATGRYLFEVVVVNTGRRKTYIENLIIEYIDFQPHIITIDKEENEIIEGKRIIIRNDSWPLTSISIPKSIYVVDSKGKKWRVKKQNFRTFIGIIEKEKQ